MDTTMLAATTQAAYVEKIHTLIWVYMPIFLVFIYIKMITHSQAFMPPRSRQAHEWTNCKQIVLKIRRLVEITAYSPRLSLIRQK